jgi:hypothetical protein
VTDGNWSRKSGDRLIDEFEHRSLVDLVRGNALPDFRAVEVHALHLGRREELLRGGAKHQDRGVGRPSVVEEIEVLQGIGDRGLANWSDEME